MEAVWGTSGGWLSAHKKWRPAVKEAAKRWSAAIKAGGDIWVKEGGQSDFTADVVRKIKRRHLFLNTRRRVHVIQHSSWNERHADERDLAYVKKKTDYVKIRDANAYLNRKGGDDTFVNTAENHPTFGRAWRAAFAYYDPKELLDFSDTGELFYILGTGEIDIDEFHRRFLEIAE
jgi:hypothetical protein